MKHRPDLVMTAYTGIIFCKNFSEFHKYAELLLSRPIFTHELADEIIKEKLRELTEKEYKKVFPIYASALQLLEACEFTVEVLDPDNTGCDAEDCHLCMVAQLARAAIAATKGGSEDTRLYMSGMERPLT